MGLGMGCGEGFVSRYDGRRGCGVVLCRVCLFTRYRREVMSTDGSEMIISPEAPPPPPQSTHTLHAALHRATHPSLGTICLSALLLALVRMATGASYALRRLPSYLPLPLQIYAGPVIYGAQVAAGALEAWAGRFGRYVLVYVGVTGEGFWPSVGRAGGLTTVERRREGEAWRRKFRTERTSVHSTHCSLCVC